MGTLRPSVEDLRALPNRTQLFRWGVSFEKIPSGVSISSQDFNFRAESATVPEVAGETVSVVIRGNETRETGKYTYNSPWNCTCIEHVDVKIQTAISQWKNLCWESENGSSGITQDKKDLEATIILTQLSNKDKPIAEYKLIGCFYETATKGDLDGATSDPMKPQLSLAYDYFLYKKL